MNKSIIELFDLAGQVAIVTGGAMGIGKSIATKLSEAGAAVVIADIIPQKQGEELLSETCPNTALAKYIEADIGKTSLHTKIISQTLKRFGRIDILVNNAGIFKYMPILDMTEETWDKTLDLNLKAVAFLSKAVAKVMIEQGGGGRIINISSVDGFKPSGNLAHYDASKGGLGMFTKALAKEVGRHGITVNSVAPGGIATPGAAQIAGQVSEEQQKVMLEQMDGFAKSLPLQRIGQPDDIGNTVLFVASEAAAYMTGSTVIVDGGLLLI